MPSMIYSENDIQKNGGKGISMKIQRKQVCKILFKMNLGRCSMRHINRITPIYPHSP
jgi:hypothetical protein